MTSINELAIFVNTNILIIFNCYFMCCATSQQDVDTVGRL